MKVAVSIPDRSRLAQPVALVTNEVLGSGRKSKVTDSLYRVNSKIRIQSLSTFALTPARATGGRVDVWTLPARNN
jgi:hypothetical protein